MPDRRWQESNPAMTVRPAYFSAKWRATAAAVVLAIHSLRAEASTPTCVMERKTSRPLTSTASAPPRRELKGYPSSRLTHWRKWRP